MTIEEAKQEFIKCGYTEAQSIKLANEANRWCNHTIANLTFEDAIQCLKKAMDTN